LESNAKWLKDSGLKVNQAKTEVCIFHRHNTATVNTEIVDIAVASKNQINILGVIFDSKSCWATLWNKTIAKTNRALNAIKLIHNHFNTKEPLQILTSSFDFILYYTAKIWQLPSQKNPIQHSLFVATALAMKMALHCLEERQT
jgi:hypothetical protein